jgi:hypothetical protein
MLKDDIVESVRSDLLSRSERGILKYGVTLDRKDLSLKDWLQHAYEETLDNALYLKRAMKDLDDQSFLCECKKIVKK